MARKEVILAAGAVRSPQLLLLSGVGPKEELDKHSISVVHNLPGVGKNLQIRPVALIGFSGVQVIRTLLLAALIF